MDGKIAKIQDRLVDGNILYNYFNSPWAFLLGDYITFLKTVVDYQEKAIENSLESFDSAEVDFYQFIERPNPDGKTRISYNHFGTFKVNNVYNMLKNLADAEKYENNQNKEDIEDIHRIVFFRGDKDIPVDVLIVKNTITKGDIKTATYHLIGYENERSVTRFNFMNEFHILPYTDFTNVTELK
jgi:hypothetical protein